MPYSEGMVLSLSLLLLAGLVDIKLEELRPLARPASIEIRFQIHSDDVAALANSPRIKELRAKGRSRTLYETLELIELVPEKEGQDVAKQALENREIPAWGLLQLYSRTSRLDDADRVAPIVPESGRDNVLARHTYALMRLWALIGKETAIQSIMQMRDPAQRQAVIDALASSLADKEPAKENLVSELTRLDKIMLALDPSGKDPKLARQRLGGAMAIRLVGFLSEALSKKEGGPDIMSRFTRFFEDGIDQEFQYAKRHDSLTSAFTAAVFSLIGGMDFTGTEPKLRPGARERYDRAVGLYLELAKSGDASVRAVPKLIEAIYLPEGRKEALEAAFEGFRPRMAEFPDLTSSVGVAVAAMRAMAGQQEQGADLLREVAKAVPSDYVFAVAARLETKRGDWDAAETFAKRIDPAGKYGVWRGLALSIFESRRVTSAKAAEDLANAFSPIFDAIQAGEDEPLKTDAIYHLALLTAMRGQTKTALTILGRFREANPDDADGKNLEQLLKRG